MRRKLFCGNVKGELQQVFVDPHATGSYLDPGGVKHEVLSVQNHGHVYFSFVEIKSEETWGGRGNSNPSMTSIRHL